MSDQADGLDEGAGRPSARANAELSSSLGDDNEEAISALTEQLRAPLGGVTPFVGAGMSIPFGFPGWSEFLRREAANSPPVLTDIDRGDYELAAQKVKQGAGGDRFHRRIDYIFGRDPDPARVTEGPLWLLASLIRGPVITTNFDRVLERVFTEANNRFEAVITGLQLDSIVRAVQTGQHVLLKIHGDARERVNRVLTLPEFDRLHEGTGEDQTDEDDITLPKLALVMFTNRPLLFIGCSLGEQDRIVKVLGEIHVKLPGLRHYAIIAAGDSDAESARRADALSACGISPIWFRPGRFDEIGDLLRRLSEEATSRRLVSASPARIPANPLSGEDAVRTFAGVRGEAGDVELDDVVPATRPIARDILEGKLIFVISETPRITLINHVAKNSFNVSEIIAETSLRKILTNHAAADVLDAVKDAVAPGPDGPSLVCRFLAALPGFLRAGGRRQAVPQVILTTDYGTMLEEAFEAACEPFHLLYHVSSGEDEGRFLHRAPDRSIRVIERPDQFPQLKESVIVKLRGGRFYGREARNPQVPESLSIEEADIVRLAARLPGALPRFVQVAMHNRSMLLLGWELLHEPDGHTLIRYGRPRDGAAWAVLPALGDDDRYWQRQGLQIVNAPIDSFVLALHARLLQIAEPIQCG